jgi:hypothetical protein
MERNEDKAHAKCRKLSKKEKYFIFFIKYFFFIGKFAKNYLQY